MVAAVEGWALAGGFEVALACDVIVAARDARFGIPEVKRGLVAAGGALLRLPRRIPYHLAMELALTGDPIGAERAHAIGIVSRLAEPGEALAAARELAATIARNAPLAVDASKRIVDRGGRLAGGRGVGAPGGDRRRGVRLRGRTRGSARVRREARAGVARAVGRSLGNAPNPPLPHPAQLTFSAARSCRPRRASRHSPRTPRSRRSRRTPRRRHSGGSGRTRASPRTPRPRRPGS